jgi:hypothetical protein
LALAPGALASTAAAQVEWSGFGRLAIVEYRVDAGFGVERFAGAALGVEGAVRVGPRLTVEVLAQGAQLSAAAQGDLDRRTGDLQGTARLAVRGWWGFYGGATLRAVASDAARQRWVLLRIGAEARPAFTGDRLRAIGRLGAIPVVAVSGLPSSAFGVDAAVGLEYVRNGLTLGALYTLERFDFPSRGGIQRLEQVSTITFRGGVRLRGRDR